MLSLKLIYYTNIWNRFQVFVIGLLGDNDYGNGTGQYSFTETLLII